MTATTSSHSNRLRGLARDVARSVAGVALVSLLGAGEVVAQGFPWPFGDSGKPPVPREPVNRPPPVPAPPPAAQPAPSGAAGAPQQPAQAWSQNRNPICVQLEQRLVQENGRANPREQLPKVESDMKAAERALSQSQNQLEKADCYEWFLFTKSLKRTRTCVDLDNQVQTTKRQLGDLEAQRQSILNSSSRSLQDDIVRELARNNCGPGYAQEARKREGGFGGGSSIWQDDESSGYGGSSNYGSLPFATYRTLCVRLCDGYYFPISFSTLPAHFQRDQDACQSKCAAPVELYYHQNPGGAVDQMVALKSQEPYTKLKSAFRYRKEYVNGCSCKQTEYLPQTPVPGAPAAPGAAADKRAEAPSAAPPPR